MKPTVLWNVIGSLALIELVSLALLMRTRSKFMAVLRDYLKGNPFDSLEKDQQEQVLAAAHLKHDRSIYRKIELFIIVYHFPALTTWQIIARKPSASPVYYYLVTMAFWFGIVFGTMKLLGKLEN